LITCDGRIEDHFTYRKTLCSDRSPEKTVPSANTKIALSPLSFFKKLST